ncbi:hypothetical protein [Solitalea canadensis]|uniref:tRNA (5-methylaminomethyl-2-thiouridylate)-methyltransferase n=1 Tax=Solitalea canadensis (strain ATCC 29591 / DSM 3403 / JCM 21819 / LMG 8368 / NBRC 15130 / NCIMB 12057 / USAM 9D) TaxID=929556 RepID=H8KUY9_SOLCM|nr:hypothetical protein [Solitalea canadensis]AFD07689.1 hypothetical protein Solca_2655 [Solitalea canadensis DSM 3403]
MEHSSKTLTGVQTLLKFSYGIIPIVAGADKFTNLLTDWSKYLHPSLEAMLPFSAHVFMMIVGVIEIVAGILVFINPQKGAYLVCAWLVLIALSLLASGNYLDVAVRDLAMAIGAFSLAKLSQSVTQNSGSLAKTALT